MQRFGLTWAVAILALTASGCGGDDEGTAPAAGGGGLADGGAGTGGTASGGDGGAGGAGGSGGTGTGGISGSGGTGATGGAPGPICEATDGQCYYIAPNPGSGQGTLDEPYGLDDLPRNDTSYCELSSTAMEALQPGDFLYFRGGQYDFVGCDGAYYATGYIRPARAGELNKPITFSAYPGESVQLTVVGGGQPALGNESHDYVRYVGFIVDHGLGRFHGTGVELAYNEVRGTFVDTGDNHDGIRLENAVDTWVHHNIVFGVTGNSNNSAGIKLYDTTDTLIEDNYIHSNTAGVFDKDSGINNTYRRNFMTGNDEQWYGNNQDQVASPRIYENVIDGVVSLHFLTNGAEVHDNLIRGDTLAGAWAGDTWNSHLWNNVVISHGTSVTAYFENQHAFTTSEPNPHIRFMDFNVYDASPTYSFGQYSSSPSEFDMTQMQGMGFEQNSQVASGIYLDEVSYELAQSWQTAGRNGDPVGPDDVSTILDVQRYGPAARPVPLP